MHKFGTGKMIPRQALVLVLAAAMIFLDTAAGAFSGTGSAYAEEPEMAGDRENDIFPDFVVEVEEEEIGTGTVSDEMETDAGSASDEMETDAGTASDEMEADYRDENQEEEAALQDDAEIRLSGAQTGGFWLTFRSNGYFTLRTANQGKNWNGKLYYATKEPQKNQSWHEWSGTELEAAEDEGSGEYVLYFRGVGNTVITGNKTNANWVLDGSGVVCDGNIETLLNYQSAGSGAHPTMGEACYKGLFLNCTGLTEAPELPAVTLTQNCYNSMFRGCTSLAEVPELPATELAGFCYQQMFAGCTYIGLYKTKKKGSTAWKVPSEGAVPETPAGWNQYMFSGTAGTVTVPEAGKIYYVKAGSQESEYGSYLTFSSSNTFTLQATKRWTGWMYYAVSDPEKDESWTVWDGHKLTAESDAEGYKLYIRGKNNCEITGHDDHYYAYPWRLNGTEISCYGSIETLLDYTEVISGQHPFMVENCFWEMFNGCKDLINAPELPAVELTSHCYFRMFKGCTGLTQAPELPATTLAGYCYGEMFQGCTGLTKAPELPAEHLVSNCYYAMFRGCSGLEEPPELPSVSLASYCYDHMFCNCTKLTRLPELPANTMFSGCYRGMFEGCSSIYIYYTKQLNSYKWRFPSEGFIEYEEAIDWNEDMLAGAHGNVKDSLEANTVYYILSNINYYTVGIQAGTGGTVDKTMVIDVSGTAISISENQLTVGRKVITATPAAGYHFAGWTGVPAGGTLTADLNITANFEIDCFTVTLTTANGTLNKSSVTNVPYNTAISASGNQLTVGSEVITATPSPGYSFSKWTGIPADGKVTANLNITANFEIDRFTVTLTAANGTLNKSSVTNVPYNTAISASGNQLTVGSEVITAAPSSGYSFLKWTGVPTSGKVTANITVTAVMTQNSSGGGGGSSTGGSGGSSGGGGGSSGGSGGSSGGGGGSSGGGSGPSGGIKAGSASPAAGTFSRFWFMNEKGFWYIKNKGMIVTAAWICDNAVSANGQNVWYLLNADGTMCSAGLVKDNTGNFYSLETTHNGYFGMLRYKNGIYDCNGQKIYLEFSQKHDGSFGAVTNAEGLASLKAIYGVTEFPIGNERCMYTATFTD